MPVVFLKRAAKTASAEAESVGDTVKKILDEIEVGRRTMAAALLFPACGRLRTLCAGPLLAASCFLVILITVVRSPEM